MTELKGDNQGYPHRVLPVKEEDELKRSPVSPEVLNGPLR